MGGKAATTSFTANPDNEQLTDSNELKSRAVPDRESALQSLITIVGTD